MNAILKVRGVEWPEPNAIQIPYWDIDSVWEKAAPLIKKGLDTQDELTLDSIYRTLIDPLSQIPMQLWLIPYQFACVTQVQQYPSGIRKCVIVVGGGEGLDNIKSQMHKLEEWAKKYMRCHKTIIYGRGGWVELEGYKRKAVIMEKDLWA